MKKFLTYFLGILFTLLFTIVVLLWAIPKPLPESSERIIEQVLASGPPNQIHGDTGFVHSNGIKIWYESIEPQDSIKGTLLLIMGLGGNALEWPLYFTQPLVEAGYRIVRFDNRSTGLSNWVEEAFTVEDMVADAFAVLDGLNISQSYVMGMSMGGMIGQVMAIENPERVAGLISFMSSGNMDDPELPGVSYMSFFEIIASGIKYGVSGSEKGTLEATIGVRQALSPALSEKRMRTLAEQGLYNLRFRREFNPDAFSQQIQAILQAGSRYAGLEKLQVPTLVIHCHDDPLIPVSHAIKMAEIIPNATLLLLENMGHDISPEHAPAIHEAMLDFLEH